MNVLSNSLSETQFYSHEYRLLSVVCHSEFMLLPATQKCKNMVVHPHVQRSSQHHQNKMQTCICEYHGESVECHIAALSHCRPFVHGGTWLLSPFHVGPRHLMITGFQPHHLHLLLLLLPRCNLLPCPLKCCINLPLVLHELQS